MAPEDRGGRGAERFGGGDEIPLFDRKRLAAHDARHVEPLNSANGNENQHEMTPEYHDEDDHEKNEGKRVDDLDGAHHQAIRVAASVARDSTVGDTNGHRHKRGEQANRERNPSSNEHSCEKVAAVGIGPEQKHGPLQWHVDLK